MIGGILRNIYLLHYN